MARRPTIAYSFTLLLLFYIRAILSQSVISSVDGELIDFQHESCSREIHNSYSFKIFHNATSFYDPEGNFEMLVRFKGVADGHILLTQNPNTTEPVYMIIIGSYNNKFSEIRKTKQAKFQVRLTTTGVLSAQQWRGFIVRYEPKDGKLMVYPEGNEHPLLSWTDTDPLDINFFSFSSYTGRVLEVAYDCHANDIFSAITNIRGIIKVYLTAESFIVEFNIRKEKAGQV